MSKDKRVQTNLMTEGSVWKSILFFSVPLILGNLLQQMYNTVDSIIVGNCVGDSALAAVGSSSSLIYLLIAFSQGASVGAGIVVSQFLGAEERECAGCGAYGAGGIVTAWYCAYSCGDSLYAAAACLDENAE